MEVQQFASRSEGAMTVARDVLTWLCRQAKRDKEAGSTLASRD